jgi:hypothetical protein
MSDEPVHAIYGTPLSEWITQTAAELPVDAVGLWQIIPDAREYFGLEGEELVSAVARTIYTLLDHGAKPVVGGKGTGHHWIEQTHYGTEPEEVVHRIMVEWCGWGYADPTHNGIWFALPELFG